MAEGKSDRSTLVLVLGILSIVLCQLLGPFVWIMGKNDLAEMRAGRMDPTNEGLTRAGMICGIVGTILLVGGILIGILQLVFVGALFATGA